MRIGLVSDTHDEVVPFEQVERAVQEAFEGAALVVHCGDLTTTGVLEHLGRIAPVVAVRSPSDPVADPPRLVEGPHVLEAGGLTLGVVNALGDAEVASVFGRPVDVVVHGGTHQACVEQAGAILLVNPGSPTLADTRTVAVLEIEGGIAQATIVELG